MMRERKLVNRLATCFVAALAAVLLAGSARAEDGYNLWLRYVPLEGVQADAIRPFLGRGVQLLADRSPTIDAASSELGRAGTTMVGASDSPHPRLVLALADRLEAGGYPADNRLAGAPIGAFSIRRVRNGRIAIAANDDIGLLYGVFAFLRHVQANASLEGVEQFSAPAMPLRMLNHWDNPDGHVERGYAGRSIFDWWHLPEQLDPRMIDYARANASVGINGAVVNNVNARAFMLEPRYIAKLKRLADAWRPYGIRVYLSARFSAPRDVGGLATADPLDAAVRRWWKARADEIYTAIPDFGGFLVKADSEGQPGPQDYGRTHAEGANMLAEAVGPRGTIIWRAFVYSAVNSSDRAKQAYDEFMPLDGQFARNVIVQVKNGPIDFQPREPFHPLFGAMPKTKLMLEVQVTKEYLGFSSHLAFLGPMWAEVLRAATGRGATVAQVVAPAGMAGVANTGSNRNWTGSDFDQANWYAFGRLAWDPSLSSVAIAREWTSQTFTRAPEAVEPIVALMLASREAVVRYMTPLGLSHLMGTGHHYGPAPWVCDLPRPEWNPCYYHRADVDGIGFDRTATGSGALTQYAPPIAAKWSDLDTIDPNYLLWFHHVRWDHKLAGGRSLWERLIAEYDCGVAEADSFARTWSGLSRYIDSERYRAVAERLQIQHREARWWRDASVAYWQSLNGLPLPEGVEPPAESLEHYKSLTFPEAPGQ
ncbi:alpha-glucuronidase [Erythrobacter sp. SDW2]|uniref:alpha-glucuronidase n=1 Tax=Erythrobacter sp. SDW2 TaxID=2907154 RepID=UPI001F2FBB6B|nr:alpha-glucuronidase [Erythrobacter sp. SDW2]UIP06070.1 alpha-glucuronidase [Erythrobacter sp. SDW2]